MNYVDEIVPLDEVPGTESAGEVDKRELSVAERLIDALSSEFEPGKYRDEYREQLLELIEKKAAGEEVVLQPVREEPARIADLMEALEASLADVGRDAGARRKKPSRAAAARPGEDRKAGTRKQTRAPARSGGRSGASSGASSGTGRKGSKSSGKQSRTRARKK